jgi:hypothetical protein
MPLIGLNETDEIRYNSILICFLKINVLPCKTISSVRIPCFEITNNAHGKYMATPIPNSTVKYENLMLSVVKKMYVKKRIKGMGITASRPL